MNFSETQATETICLANARLVLPDQVVSGYLLVKDGEISELGEGTQVPDGAVDCAGDHVIPGLIELHTDNLERHLEPRPAVSWPHQAAILAHDAELASTGITTVFDALRVGYFEQGKDSYLAQARKVASEIIRVREAGGLRISHFLHLRAEICSETLEKEMADFGPDDRIGIVSLMDHTPGQRQFRDLQALRVYLTKKRSMNDVEFQDHVLHLKALQVRFREKHEKAAVGAAQRYGAVLASHDDTTAEHVSASKRCGVCFAEFPTTVEAAATSREQGIAVMMGAPNVMRGESHSGNVSARELADAGLLDIVSSDYIPAALLLSAFYLADRWQDLPRAIACVTEHPARVTGLTDRGRLAPGLRADLVRVGMLDSMPLVRGVWCRGHRVG
ncbi:MAG: alpha-D-ribose 1-methylphosphonate 5-triphosphate diphosphatase [Granulosicoccus sp.]